MKYIFKYVPILSVLVLVLVLFIFLFFNIKNDKISLNQEFTKSELTSSNQDYTLLQNFYTLDQSGSESDKSKALSILLELANRNYYPSFFHLGNYYFSGIGMKAKNYEKALYWYSKSAEFGDDNSIRMLGYIYDQGFGVPRNEIEARKYFSLAAEKGNSDALIALGSYIYNDQSIPNRKRWALAENYYLKATNDEFGRGEAFVNLARMSLRGELSSTDSSCTQNSKALDFYRKASVAKTSHEHIKQQIIENVINLISSDNQCNLSQNSAEDLLFLKSYLSFLNSFHSKNENFSLPNTNSFAKENSFDHFYSSERANAPIATTLKYLDEAISYGYLKAYSIKATYLLYVIKDSSQIKRANEMLYISSMLGDANAMYQIGYILNSGNFGINYDPVSAKLFFYGASQRGNIEANIKIGDMYQNGLGGLSKDYKKAIDYFSKAAYNSVEPSGEAFYKISSAYFNSNIYRIPPNLSCDWLTESKSNLDKSFLLSNFHYGSKDHAIKLNKRINFLLYVKDC
jgi:TPR repeat protein